MHLFPQALTAFASRLRFPQLFFLFLAIFILDVLLPDFIPFVDELLFGLITLMFGLWKKRKKSKEDTPTDVAEQDTGHSQRET